MSLTFFKLVRQEVEWSTRARRGRHIRKNTDVFRRYGRVVGTHHKARNKNIGKREDRHMGATKIPKTSSRTDGCGLVKPSNSLTEWHIRKHGASEIHRKELRLLRLNCTNICESECGQQRALVDRLPNARLRARCASLRRGNDSRRQLQGGRNETSTQCQGRRNGNGSVTVCETLPPGACSGLRVANSKNGSKRGGALETGIGANAKEAVTAKFFRQDNVNAALDVAWQIPPFCKYLIAGPSCLRGPMASRTMGEAPQTKQGEK